MTHFFVCTELFLVLEQHEDVSAITEQEQLHLFFSYFTFYSRTTRSEEATKMVRGEKNFFKSLIHTVIHLFKYLSSGNHYVIPRWRNTLSFIMKYILGVCKDLIRKKKNAYLKYQDFIEGKWLWWWKTKMPKRGQRDHPEISNNRKPLSPSSQCVATRGRGGVIEVQRLVTWQELEPH